MLAKWRKLTVYSVFVLAVAWGIYQRPWRDLPTSAPVQSEPGIADSIETAQASVAATLTSEDLQERSLAGDWTVDPFRKKKPEAVAVPRARVARQVAPVLQGIMAVGNKRACVIGGQILKKGDQFGGWIVLNVATNSVELVGLSSKKRLTLHAGTTNGKGRR
jgi:hypothetical protein